MIASFRSSSKF